MKKTAFMEWVDEQIDADARLAQDVDQLLDEMKVSW